MNFGVWELLLVVVGFGFYGFLLWLAWTLVMSVKGIRQELALLRKDVRRAPTDGPGGGAA